MPVPTQSCLRHPARPAVARCPTCRQAFCRECIVEHDFKLICADCLRLLIQSQTPEKPRFRLPLAPALQLLLGFAIVWLGFYLAGMLLERIPAEVHDGLIWTR